MTAVSKFYLFADDTNLFYTDKDLKFLENNGLYRLCHWPITKRLSLNIIKSSELRYLSTKARNVKYEVNFKIFDHHSNVN